MRFGICYPDGRVDELQLGELMETYHWAVAASHTDSKFAGAELVYFDEDLNEWTLL